jgi:hypothetical protein
VEEKVMSRKFSFSLTLALVLALLVTAVALADNLLSDGDGLTPVVDADLSLGNVCLGSVTTKPIAHAIKRAGGGNTYANSASVVVSIVSTSSGVLATSGGGTINLPANWVSLANTTMSNSVSSSVSFVANTLGTFSGTVNYKAVGAENGGGTLTRTAALTVTANVVNCDTTAPTLTLPANMTVEAAGTFGAAVTFSATASDANPANPVVTCSPASGSTFALDVTKTVNCSATDAAGNTASGSFTVKVVDTTPPTVTPPFSIVAEAAGASGAVVTYSGESAADLVDGALLAACLPASGSTFPLGLNTVTCSATDAHSNTGTSIFTINVKDTTAPVLSLPAEITKEATGASGAVVDFTVSASDSVDGDIAVLCNHNPGETFPLGKTNVACSATDKNGNTNSGNFNVNVVDTTAPALTLPADFSVEATGPLGAVATFSASASDVVDGIVAVSCTPASGSTFPLGENAIACSATDVAGNTANGSFKITVADTTPPTLTLPADQELEATGPDGAAASFSASATDLVDGSLPVACSASSGVTFPLGTTTVACSVKDSAGNEASGSFVIIVKDTTAPIISYLSRTGANANGWNKEDVTVLWACSDLVAVKSDFVSQTLSAEGEGLSATGTCEDTSGNKASDIQAGINIDKTAPTISGAPDSVANVNGWYNVDVTVSFTCTDGLSGVDTCSPESKLGEGAAQVVTGLATDKAGNTASATVSGINIDKTAPTITGAPDRAANGNGWYNTDITVSFTCADGLSGVDACSQASTLGEGAAQAVTGSVADKAGNSASFTVAGINIDKTAPTITGAPDRVANGNGWYNADVTINFICTDGLSGLDVCSPASTLGEGVAQVVSGSATDKAGNTASTTVAGINIDKTAPLASAFRTPLANLFGWNNSAVMVSFSGNDVLSGLAFCDSPVVLSGEGLGQSAAGYCYDKAGNASEMAEINDINIDFTAPSITWIGGPADGGAYYFGSVPAAPDFSFSDSLSGLDKFSFSGYSTAVGFHTMNVTASDKAENTAADTRSYDVLAWTLRGFYQPVDMSGVYNVVKGGSTVPLKFEVFAGTNELTATSIVKSFVQTKIACSTSAAIDEIELTTTGGTSLRYDTTAGQFIQNWQTPKLAGSCYKVTMTTQDGSSLSAFFKLK